MHIPHPFWLISPSFAQSNLQLHVLTTLWPIPKQFPFYLWKKNWILGMMSNFAPFSRSTLTKFNGENVTAKWRGVVVLSETSMFTSEPLLIRSLKHFSSWLFKDIESKRGENPFLSLAFTSAPLSIKYQGRLSFHRWRKIFVV